MSKVLTRRQMDEAAGTRDALDLEALVAPSADDLLELTQASLGDVNPPVSISRDQRDQLRMALRARLAGSLLDNRALERMRGTDAGWPPKGFGDA